MDCFVNVDGYIYVSNQNFRCFFFASVVLTRVPFTPFLFKESKVPFFGPLVGDPGVVS